MMGLLAGLLGGFTGPLTKYVVLTVGALLAITGAHLCIENWKGNLRAEGQRVCDAGWEKKIRSRSYMTENPGLSAGAARFLASRKVSMVGIDGPSIDAGSDARFTAHRVLLAKNVLAVENLCNLRAINRDRFMLVVAPLKLRGATGSPVRALAIL